MATAKKKNDSTSVTVIDAKDNLPAVAVPPTNEFLSMIERLATNKDVDLAKMTAIVDLQERILDRNAKAQFDFDFVRMKPKLPRVIKLHKNDQTKSKYAKLEDINDVIEPILGDFGFGTSMRVTHQDESGVNVLISLRHTGGHIESTPVYMPIDDVGMAGAKNKTRQHGISSAIMYARRTGECLLLNISTGDDIDGNRPGTDQMIFPEKAIELRDDLKEAGGDEKKFLEFMGVESFEKIPLTDLVKATNMIAAKKAESDKKKKKAEGAE